MMRWAKIAGIAGGIVALYFVDVWLLGSLAAAMTAAEGWITGTPDWSLAGWYWNHPFSVAVSWVTSGELSHPEVRRVWLLLNMTFVFLFSVLYFSRKMQSEPLKRNSNDNDIQKVRFKKVNFNLERQLARTKPGEVFLGLDDRRRPVTIPVARLPEHIHILGGSGSGKTAFAVIPLCVQAARRGFGVIVIDFKGDRQAIHIVAREAEKAGKRFYFFTLQADVSSNSYNPLANGSALSKVERVMSALELVFTGEAKFYSYVQQSVFIPLLKYFDRKRVAYTLKDVALALSDGEFLLNVTGQEVSSSQLRGLTAALTPYADLPQINAVPTDIDLREVMQAGDVAYFELFSAAMPEIASAIGRMLAMDLQALAAGRTQRDRLCLIAIDEFQNMACQAFTNLVSKVRSANYSLVLAHQALGDLRSLSDAFLNIVLTNTATRVIFNVADPGDAEFFARASGQTVSHALSTSRSSTGAGYGSRESVGESLAEKDISYIHSNIFLSLPSGKSVVFRRRQLPIIANHSYLVSKQEKEEMESMPYPEPHFEKKELPSGYRTFRQLMDEMVGSAIESQRQNENRGGIDVIRM